MTLDAYIRSTGRTEVQLAKAAGCTQATISRIRTGDRTAGITLALRIEQATGGAVPARSLPLSQRTRKGLKALDRLRPAGAGGIAAPGAA